MHARNIPIWRIATHQNPVDILRRGFAVQARTAPRFRKAS
jgi:hypothetical protein